MYDPYRLASESHPVRIVGLIRVFWHLGSSIDINQEGRRLMPAKEPQVRAEHGLARRGVTSHLWE